MGVSLTKTSRLGAFFASLAALYALAFQPATAQAQADRFLGYAEFQKLMVSAVARTPELEELWKWADANGEKVYLGGGSVRKLAHWYFEKMRVNGTQGIFELRPPSLSELAVLKYSDFDLVMTPEALAKLKNSGLPYAKWDVITTGTYALHKGLGGAAIEKTLINPSGIEDPFSGLEAYHRGELSMAWPDEAEFTDLAREKFRGEGYTRVSQVIRMLRFQRELPECKIPEETLAKMRLAGHGEAAMGFPWSIGELQRDYRIVKELEKLHEIGGKNFEDVLGDLRGANLLKVLAENGYYVPGAEGKIPDFSKLSRAGFNAAELGYAKSIAGNSEKFTSKLRTGCVRLLMKRFAGKGAREMRSAYEPSTKTPDNGLPEVTRSGYRSEVAGMDLAGPHTIHDLGAYLADNLGEQTLRAARASKLPFVLCVGDGAETMARLAAAGWTIFDEVSKREGYHGVFLAKDREGRQAYLITRVNGDDRVVHLHSLLKLAGVGANRISTLGETRSWKPEYLVKFGEMGYVPDLVVYGFGTTALRAILERERIANAGALLKLYRASVARKAKFGGSDLANFPIYILRFRNGKTAWIFQNMYGDLSLQLLEALSEHGAKKFVYLGTAGALHSGFNVGDLVIPERVVGPDGKARALDWLEKVSDVPVKGTYQRVSTPNLETREWTERSIKSGVDLIDVELGHWIEYAKRNPALELTPVLAVSDVLTGPNHRDMTKWSDEDRLRLRDTFLRVIGASLGFKSPADYGVAKFQSELIVKGGGRSK